MKLLSVFACLIAFQGVFAQANGDYSFTVVGGDFVMREGHVQWQENLCKPSGNSTEVIRCELAATSIVEIIGTGFSFQPHKALKILSQSEGNNYESIYLTGIDPTTDLVFTFQINKKNGLPLKGKLSSNMDQVWSVSFK